MTSSQDDPEVVDPVQDGDCVICEGACHVGLPVRLTVWHEDDVERSVVSGAFTLEHFAAAVREGRAIIANDWTVSLTEEGQHWRAHFSFDRVLAQGPVLAVRAVSDGDA